MSKDTIYREDAIRAIFSKPAYHGSDGSWYHSDDIRDAVDNTPSADRPRGKWIDKGWHGDWQFETDGRGNCWHEYECSECGYRKRGGKSNFCPDCGADMRGDKE